MLNTLSQALENGRHLTIEEIRSAVEELVSESVTAPVKANFLSCLSRKGETASEIAAFALALRDKSVCPPIRDGLRAGAILDVCGTGGDRLNTFNISTTVAIVCSAAGVPVAKHGNRAITSQAGSADVLEALGIPIDLSPPEAARSLADRGFAFFFAPNYHPAFKHIAPARKLCAERGQRTIFNFLGPLLNPARPSAQLVGVPRPELCQPLACVLQLLGVRRAMVVSGRTADSSAPGLAADACLDELSTLGENVVAEFAGAAAVEVTPLRPGDFPVQPATLKDLCGGDRQTNAEIVRQLLAGQDRGPRRDAVLLNSAAALLVSNRARTLSEGWRLAADVIDSGQAQRKLKELTA